MLVIRNEQMEVFKQRALRSFEDKMVVHLFKFAQRHCETIGKDKVRETIRLGIRRAKSYGLTTQGPVRFYIDMMFMFGSAFDTDPQVPWTAEILNSQDYVDGMDRADRLYDKAMDYIDKVVGPDGAYALRALHAISVFARQRLTLSSEDFTIGMLNEMHHLYPRKCAYVGDESLRLLIGEGGAGARRYEFSSEQYAALFVLLMFAFGHGIADDPLFPWSVGTLNDPRIADSLSTAERLKGAMLLHIEDLLR